MITFEQMEELRSYEEKIRRTGKLDSRHEITRYKILMLMAGKRPPRTI